MTKNIVCHITSLINPSRHIVTTVMAAAILAASSSCSRTAAYQAEESADIASITVSIPPLEYFAKSIGGDSVDVTTLLPAGADPETFEPGVNVMRALSGAGAIATTGTLRFEESVLTNLQANNPDLKIFDMSDGIPLIFGTHQHASHGEENHNHDDGEADPHIWSSVKNARIIADNMLKALSETAPQHTGYYTRRHNALIQHLDSLDHAYSAKIHKADGNAFLIWHPSLSYFARDYGLHQIAFNVENKETSPLQLRKSLQQASGNAPLAFFIPEGTDQRRTATIAAEAGLTPVPVNLMSADWEEPLGKVADALSKKPHN